MSESSSDDSPTVCLHCTSFECNAKKLYSSMRCETLHSCIPMRPDNNHNHNWTTWIKWCREDVSDTFIKHIFQQCVYVRSWPQLHDSVTFLQEVRTTSFPTEQFAGFLWLPTLARCHKNIGIHNPLVHVSISTGEIRCERLVWTEQVRCTWIGLCNLI